MNDKYILAFETSCDETSVAVLKNGTELLSNVIASQVNSHKRFGGVVPEVASRHHVEQITACIDEALEQAGITAKELSAVAVTEGPGLVGALLVGIMAAKTFAWANKLPLIPVNHMAGHLMAAALVDTIEYPAMALLVSGGHTELVLMKHPYSFEVIGETLDDAVGEAYDKVGRVLNLPYPGGPVLDKMAHLGKASYALPKPLDDDSYNFSFSGLKSAVINLAHNHRQKGLEINQNDLATSFQNVVVDVLVDKTIRAAKEYGVKEIMLAGGVSANRGLREKMKEQVAMLEDVQLSLPPMKCCTDNAMMIALAGKVMYDNNKFSDLSLGIKPHLDLELESIGGD